jgi:hypothetical protein
MTMTLIETKTLLSAAASIEFTSIPQDGTDLVVLVSMRANSGGNVGGNGKLIFNDNTTGYSSRQLLGTGSGVQSQTSTTAGRIAGFENGSSSTANTFTSSTIYIPNYTGSTNKSWSVDNVTENNGTEAYSAIVANLWSNTAAITKVAYSSVEGVNLAIGSTISLYKITKGSDGIVTTS